MQLPAATVSGLLSASSSTSSAAAAAAAAAVFFLFRTGILNQNFTQRGEVLKPPKRGEVSKPPTTRD